MVEFIGDELRPQEGEQNRAAQEHRGELYGADDELAHDV